MGSVNGAGHNDLAANSASLNAWLKETAKRWPPETRSNRLSASPDGDFLKRPGASRARSDAGPSRPSTGLPHGLQRPLSGTGINPRGASKLTPPAAEQQRQAGTQMQAMKFHKVDSNKFAVTAHNGNRYHISIEPMPADDNVVDQLKSIIENLVEIAEEQDPDFQSATFSSPTKPGSNAIGTVYAPLTAAEYEQRGTGGKYQSRTVFGGDNADGNAEWTRKLNACMADLQRVLAGFQDTRIHIENIP